MRPEIVSKDSVHAEAAMRGRASTPLALMTYALPTAAFIVFALSIVFGAGELNRPWELAGLIVLTVIATQREAIFGDDTAINESMIVIAGAAGAAVAGRPIWTAGACGIAAGLHWAQIRDRALRKIAINTACTSLAALGATVSGLVVRPSGASEWVSALVAGVVVVMVYWLIDNLLIAAVLNVAEGGSFRTHATELIRSETLLLPFALLGFLSGYLLADRLGTWTGLIAIAGLMCVAELLVLRHVGFDRLRGLRTIGVLGVAGICASLTLTPLIDGIPRQGILPALLVIALGGGWLLWSIRRELIPIAIVMVAITAAMVSRNDSPVTAGVVGGLAAAIPLLCSRATARGRLTAGFATCLCAALAAIAVTLIQSSSISVPGAAIVGVVAALGGLVGWHLWLAGVAAATIGRSATRASVGFLVSDLMMFAWAGLMGGVAGWVGRDGDYLGLAVLGAGFALTSVCGRRRQQHDDRSIPYEDGDDGLVELVHSAVLDLPASRPGNAR